MLEKCAKTLFLLLSIWMILMANDRMNVSCRDLQKLECSSSEDRCNTVLNGVTIKSQPFLMIENNRFTGLCVEVMNAIRQRTGLNYTLYVVDNGKYGPLKGPNGMITGIIADVHSGKADFGIADMTVTPIREKYVSFTEPFFTFSISGLVHKKNARFMKTIDDLVNRPTNLSVGVFEQGSTYSGIKEKPREAGLTSQTMAKLREKIMSKDSNLVKTNAEALRKVLTERFVFIQEEPRNMYLAAENCNLTNLRDPNVNFYKKYAIAVRKDSHLLVPFNAAIVQLTKEGFFQKLKDKYFNQDKCTSSSETIVLTFTVSLFAFAIHFLKGFVF